MRMMPLYAVLAGLALAQTPPAPQSPAPAPAAQTEPAKPPTPAAPPPQLVTPGPQLLQVRIVYLLPMANGMDQYLASRLTRDGLLQVTADPSKADGILTDRIGKSFEAEMLALYPPPPEATPAPPKDEEAESPDSAVGKIKSTTENRVLPGGRGRNTFFLVSRGSREVLWSDYERPASLQSKDLDSSAGAIAGRLKKSYQKLMKEASQPAPAGR